MTKKNLFRQVALNKLSSPEELDRLLRVTSPKGWIALIGIGVLLLTATVWAVVGKIPIKLVGQQCILVKTGGINVVTAASGGRLSDLAIEVGDTVTRGQTIGRLEQYDMLQKIEAEEARLKEVQAQYDQAQAVALRAANLRAATLSQQGQNLQHQLAAAHQRHALVKDRIETQSTLYDQGLITKQTLIASRLEATAAQLEAENIQAQFKQLELTRLEETKQSDNEVESARNRLDEVKRSIVLMVRDAKNFTSIVSPYSGRILEVKVTDGQLVERGTNLVGIESSGADVNEIEAYVYLPASEGKKVYGGMKLEISPSTAKREEFGFMPAFVASVAEYPSTDEGLMRVFGNNKLVQQLSGEHAPIQIVASLKPAYNNASNYEWSTRRGPPFSIQSGTSCSASITLSEKRPVEFVIPILKKALALD